MSCCVEKQSNIPVYPGAHSQTTVGSTLPLPSGSVAWTTSRYGPPLKMRSRKFGWKDMAHIDGLDSIVSVLSCPSRGRSARNGLTRAIWFEWRKSVWRLVRDLTTSGTVVSMLLERSSELSLSDALSA